MAAEEINNKSDRVINPHNTENEKSLYLIHDLPHTIEQRYIQIINSITDYIYSVRFGEIGEIHTLHTPTCFIITGYSIDEFNANPSLWIDIVHDEDKEKVLFFSKQIGNPNSESIIEHRIWHKSGKLIWIQNTIITYTNEEGKFIGYDGVISDISERKTIAEQVRLSEEKFRGVFNLSPDALLLSDAVTGTIYDFNQKFLNEFNLTRETLFKIKNDYQLSVIEDWGTISQEIHINNKLSDKEVWGISKNGKRNTYLLSSNIISVSDKDYILYQFRNISKRKKLEYLLRFIGQRGSLSEGTRFFNDLAGFISDLFGVSHVIIGETDHENQQSHNLVLLANGQLMDIEPINIGNSPFKELISKGAYVCNAGFRNTIDSSSCLLKWDLESFIGIVLNNSEGNTSGYIAVMNSKPLEDLNEVLELLQIVALRVSHEMENMHHLVKIAEYREHLEDLVILRTTELENTIQALNIAKVRAEAASNAKSIFLSNMSHELRTPLNAILGYASSLQKEQNINDKQKQNLNTIETCGQHLLSIINEILDYSKIEAGKICIENSDFNLSKLLFSALDMTKQKAWEKKLDFVYEQQSDLPEIVNGDEKRLRQIILNLLSNSLKYTERGTVTIRVRYNSPVQHILYFEVEDTGKGIAEENFDKIFEPFTQLHQNKSYIEGTGLGLSITKNLVELMKGRIYFRSTYNKGTTFYVELPLTAVSYKEQGDILTGLNIGQGLGQKFDIPDIQLLKQIIDFAKTGNFTSIENLLNTISENSGYSDFCSLIRNLSNKYNDDGIIEFCSKYMEK